MLNPATGKQIDVDLDDAQRQQYYNAYVQAEATLRSAEVGVQQAQVAFDTARQAEVNGIQLAEQQLASAQAGLDKLRAGADADDLAAARAQIASSKANLDKLVGEQRAGALEAAQAAVDQAQANLDRLRAGVSSNELEVAAAEIQSAQAALQLARVVLVTLLSYSFHVRGHYDDRDQALVASAGHVIGEADTLTQGPHLVEGSGGLEIGFRIYDQAGGLRERTPGVEAPPPIEPHVLLTTSAGPPYDALAGLALPLAAVDTPAGGAFGLLSTPEQRWRVYVQPIRQAGQVTGYIEALTPLGRLDSSIQTYRSLLLALGLGGLATVLVGGWAIAGGALRPIARMSQTAGAITHSRDLSHRPTPPQHDELAQLAATFNEMLASIEAAYGAQQRFVSDASHELRAPLTAIQGNLELIRRHPEMTPAERDEALAEAEREAGRLTRLVADLLALARADAGVTLQRRLVDLDVVVLDAFRTARSLARGQELALDPFEPLQVLGDEDRLRQLVLILLDNALKYTPGGGQVTLGLRQHDQQVELTVRDTGLGIAAEELPHVFERFYRADPARSRDPGGTGLGLVIARWIAGQHGGDVTLSSMPGQGTIVTVLLPPAPAEPTHTPTPQK